MSGMKASDCLVALNALVRFIAWVLHLLDKLIGRFWFTSNEGPALEFPDDVLVDILSRLPAECVLKCRMVCRQWRSFTSSGHFIKFHLSRSPRLIFVQGLDHWSRREDELAFLVFDHKNSKRKKFKKLRLGPGIQGCTRLVDSCGGLVLFVEVSIRRHRFFVLNPVTYEQITENCHTPGFICGFFYHSLTNEFRILYFHYDQYLMYTLNGRTWREIKSPSFFHCPPKHPPAIYNGALHWVLDWPSTPVEDMPPCEHGVFVFWMDAEDFSTLPHPGSSCRSRPWHWHRNMDLFMADEHITFCSLDDYAKRIDIWILQDYSSWAWRTKWKLNLNLVERPLECTDDDGSNRTDCTRVVDIQNGELWLQCVAKGMFVYQLEQNTVRRFGGRLLGINGSTRNLCTPYTASLVSPYRLLSATTNA